MQNNSVQMLLPFCLLLSYICISSLWLSKSWLDFATALHDLLLSCFWTLHWQWCKTHFFSGFTFCIVGCFISSSHLLRVIHQSSLFLPFRSQLELVTSRLHRSNLTLQVPSLSMSLSIPPVMFNGSYVVNSTAGLYLTMDHNISEIIKNSNYKVPCQL